MLTNQPLQRKYNKQSGERFAFYFTEVVVSISVSPYKICLLAKQNRTRAFQSNSPRAIFLSAVGSLKQVSFFQVSFLGNTPHFRIKELLSYLLN